MSERQIAIQKLFSITAKNQLQLVALLMKGNQQWFCCYSFHSGCYETYQENFEWRLCLEAWHINPAHAPVNHDDGGLLPDTYLHHVRKKAAN